MASSPITSWQTEGKKVEAETDFIFLGSKITAVTIAMKLKDTCFLEESFDKPRQHIKKQRHHFANKGPSSQSYGFLSSHVRMWELDHREGWALKNWCFWIVMLEETLESPLDSKDIKPVNPKGNQPWIFTGKNDAKVEIPNTLATWCKELTHWKRPWCWERLRAWGEENNRG